MVYLNVQFTHAYSASTNLDSFVQLGPFYYRCKDLCQIWAYVTMYDPYYVL